MFSMSLVMCNMMNIVMFNMTINHVRHDSSYEGR